MPRASETAASESAIAQHTPDGVGSPLGAAMPTEALGEPAFPDEGRRPLGAKWPASAGDRSGTS